MSNNYAQEFANRIPWQDILEPVGFRMNKEILYNGKIRITWMYDDGEINLSLFTCGATQDAFIFDWDHIEKARLPKLEATRKFRCNDNWAWARALLLEGIDLGDNLIDRIGRKAWTKFQQSSEEMAPEVRYVEALFQAMVDEELAKCSARDYAKQKFDELQFTQDGPATKPVSLEKFLESDIATNPYVIEDLLVSQGKVFVVAKAIGWSCLSKAS